MQLNMTDFRSCTGGGVAQSDPLHANERAGSLSETRRYALAGCYRVIWTCHGLKPLL